MTNPSAYWLSLVAFTLGQSTARAQRSDSTPAAIRYLHHSAWSGETVPSLGGEHLVARSGDGYLWLSGLNGFVRFDGVRFTVFDSTVSPLLRFKREGYCFPVVSPTTGEMLIATPDRILGYRNGELRVVVDSLLGEHLAADRAGNFFIYGEYTGGVYELVNGQAPARRIKFPATAPDSDLTGIVPDTGTGLWLGTRTRGLWHVIGSSAERVSPGSDTTRVRARPLIQTRDGTMWANGLGVGGGLSRLVDGRWLPPPGVGANAVVDSRAASQDSDGAVWFATSTRGVMRLVNGELSAFGKANGLSDDAVIDVRADAGGSVWIATASGSLDQLHASAFTTLNERNGFPLAQVWRFSEDESGSVWALANHFKVPIELTDAPLAAKAELMRIRSTDLPTDQEYEVLSAARDGGVWLGPYKGGLVRYRHGRAEWWTARDGMPADRFYAATEAPDGSVWLCNAHGGFGVFRGGRFRALTLPGMGRGICNGGVVDGRGHVWISTADSAYLHEIVGDSIVRTFVARDGVVRPIAYLALEHGDTLWGITDSGFVRVAAGRVARVVTPATLAAGGRRPSLAIGDGYLWTINSTQVARFVLADLHAAADGKPVSPTARIFGVADGLLTPRSFPFPLFPIFRAHDGRIWLSTPAGVAITDPSRDVTDRVPPIAHVEELEAGDRVFHGGKIALPPNPDRVSIHYTVTGLVSPERTRIEVRLDGVDESWASGVADRVINYVQLRPGSYHFRVRGWNSDGVASPNEATLDFEVLPAWYQTALFRTLAVLLSGGLIALIATLVQRRRHAAARLALTAQYEATLAERARIAQDLHDTVLQGFIGVTLQLKATERALPPTHAVAQTLKRVQVLARNSLREARERVWDLKDSPLVSSDIASSLDALAQEQTSGLGVEVSLVVNGGRRRLDESIESTAFRIGREAITNALRHGSPNCIEIIASFDEATFALEIRDDGRGFKPEEAAEAQRQGHFGITGARERAARLGGRYEIRSREGGGTVVSVELPLS